MSWLIIYGLLLIVFAAGLYCLYRVLKWVLKRFGRLTFWSVIVFCVVVVPLTLFLIYRYALDADIVKPSAKIANVRYCEAFESGKRGLMVHYDITCSHLKGRNIINSIEILGQNKDGNFYYLKPISKTSEYRSRKERAGISRTEYCDSNYKKWKDYTFFIPYDELFHRKGENKYQFYLWIDYQKTKKPSSDYEHLFSHDKNRETYYFYATYDKASPSMTAAKGKTQNKATTQKATAQKAATAATDTTKTSTSDEGIDWEALYYNDTFWWWWIDEEEYE